MKLKHKKLGLVVEKHLDYHYKIISDGNNKGELIKSFLVEKSDDWEEVKGEYIGGPLVEVKEEPNYLITAFRNKNIPTQIFYLQSKGGYNETASMGEMSLKSMLNGFASLEDGALEIYSVKNFKGEFTLGEKVQTAGDKFTISKFDINKDGCYVYFEETADHDGLELIFKLKKPLYTTTDGVEIMEGDKVHLYLHSKEDVLSKSANTTIMIGNFSQQDREVANRYLTFTSEENRDKYIKENTKKPVFVSADGKEIFEGDAIYHFHKPFEYMMHKSIARHNTIYGDIIFYTEEKAKEYIDNNKPKYSLADIENCYPHANITGNRIKDIPVVATLFSNLKKLGK